MCPGASRWVVCLAHVSLYVSLGARCNSSVEVAFHGDAPGHHLAVEFALVLCYASV